MRFTKMEGCGNDYIYINCFEEEVKWPEALAVAMSERHFGVGADGLVLILPSETADFRMRMFNLDGSEGEMCGNAVRCIGKYVYERGLTKKDTVTLETMGGIKTLKLHIQQENVIAVTVDMGEPILEAEKIPVRSEKHPVIGETLRILDREFAFTCVSMGNPHAVTFVDNTQDFDVEKYGSLVEYAPIFPNKTNTEFVQVIDRTHLAMRVWERGSGETMACGTGASAALVAAVLNGLCERKVRIQLLGGTLEIEWRESDNHVYMTGPARFSFDGVWLR
ncbi:diaminopimelate epimerase [Anaerotignum lactatifermentans]|uniref:Diaminopimelate epimerase n=1 Tax=Anaerotignum lactatifermentans TaxID=160404 RepID=A0ABS2G8A5_9FIRM|nr:diaminopimelate epimerase [Anaerotignum lactatifermentans]MBM6828128.1 diaminopimelate epimerase [Anaerotignum lactatifermentans]MBM6876709.1 diaminopimelate epimerase [Anaerotignum lactatifermentans]MBM6949711.1 diaminopimelate epimerase [Anaerotignum lactatifermentans]